MRNVVAAPAQYAPRLLQARGRSACMFSFGIQASAPHDLADLAPIIRLCHRMEINHHPRSIARYKKSVCTTPFCTTPLQYSHSKWSESLS
jgi:hypothetical protein